jgi:hypothetical protein
MCRSNREDIAEWVKTTECFVVLDEATCIK